MTMANAKIKAAAMITALVTVMTAAGCGAVEDLPKEDDTASAADSRIVLPAQPEEDAASSQTDDTSSVQTEDTSSAAPFELRISTFYQDEVPELVSELEDILRAAKGSREEFDKVFSTDLMIEAFVRSSGSTEAKRQEVRDSFSEDERRRIADNVYDTLHAPLSDDPFTGSIEGLSVQSDLPELEDNMIFLLDFDAVCASGKKSFYGTAYYVDGKWGAMFEPKTDTGSTVDDLLKENKDDEE